MWWAVGKYNQTEEVSVMETLGARGATTHEQL